jgi:hypothetical protein
MAENSIATENMPPGILVDTESMPLEAFRKQAHSKHAKTEKEGIVREKSPPQPKLPHPGHISADLSYF